MRLRFKKLLILHGTRINRLRKLISFYIATNVKIILKYTLFIKLIKGKGAFI
jgi:hypothetical protein